MPSPWLLYVGLVAAILGNAAAISVQLDAGQYAIAGNVAAMLVSVGAIFLVRYRQKRGWPE